MQSVTVRKPDLMGVIASNLEEHVVQYEEALDAYRLALKKELTSMVGNIDLGRKVDTYIDLQEPILYSDEYEAALLMLEYSVEDEVTLTAAEFNKLVRNKWGWTESFAQTYNFYTATT